MGAIGEIDNAIDVLEKNFPVQMCIQDTSGIWHINKGERFHDNVSWITDDNPEVLCDNKPEIKNCFVDRKPAAIEWKVPTCEDCRDKYHEIIANQIKEYEDSLRS